MIIRVDDNPWGLELDELKKFCDICDRWGCTLLHAIPIYGECYGIDSSWTNERIVAYATHEVEKEKIEYLLTRNDLISVHGKYHTHFPTSEEIKFSKDKLTEWGFNPTYYTPPFNEYDGVDTHGLTLSVMDLHKGERLEDYLVKMPRFGQQPPEFVYLHAWRFWRGWYSPERLDECLARTTSTQII